MKKLLFAGIIVLGCVIAFFVLNSSEEVVEKPSSSQEKPSWMAAPQPTKKPAEKEKAMKVGVIGPETGVEAHYGLGVLEGVLMAADRLNRQSGPDEKTIEVLHFDVSGGSGRVQEVVTNLIKQNVVAIFSAPTGWSTFTPTHLANRTKTLFISIGTRRKIGRSGDYVLNFSLPDEIAIDEMLKFAVVELGLREYALVTSSSYDYSLAISSVFKQAVMKHGSRIVSEADTYDTFTGKTNFDAVIETLKKDREGLQAIIFTGSAEEAAHLARLVREAGFTIPFLGSEDLFTLKFLEQGKKAVRGTLTYATFAPDRGETKVMEFVKDHVDRKNAQPDRFSALAFDAFNLLAEALKNASSMKSSDVREALLNLKGTEGVTGVSNWAQDGTPVKYPFLYRVESGDVGEKFVLLNANRSQLQ